jgi:hypothetical protein
MHFPSSGFISTQVVLPPTKSKRYGGSLDKNSSRVSALSKSLQVTLWIIEAIRLFKPSVVKGVGIDPLTPQNLTFMFL